MKEFLKDLYEAMGGRHLSLWLVQVAVWAIIILALPMATWLSTQDAEAARTSFNVVFDLLLSPFLIYFKNSVFDRIFDLLEILGVSVCHKEVSTSYVKKSGVPTCPRSFHGSVYKTGVYSTL